MSIAIINMAFLFHVIAFINVYMSNGYFIKITFIF